MKSTKTIYPILCMVLMLCWGVSSFAQISIPNSSFTHTEDFSTLASSGTSSTVPTGWAYVETGTSSRNDGLYTANNGSDNAGDTYSYGATSNSSGLLEACLVARLHR
ncbi:MAG: hypothetical protein IPM82_14865 [Saprospiraceae bacterium]|nr:hypothetical protein [Saprospiraceae bacterium]